MNVIFHAEPSIMFVINISIYLSMKLRMKNWQITGFKRKHKVKMARKLMHLRFGEGKDIAVL